MNNEDTQRLAGVIELLLESSSRVNQAKPQPYWYPLAMATYGVEEIIEALDSMCSFRTSMWEKTAEFEKRFAQYQGSTYAIMVNSGSSADLLLSYLLTNPLQPLMEPEDEILIPAVTWPTHVWSPLMAGLRVCLVDVDPSTLNIDIDDLERKITPRTKAIFLVHLLGNPCEMDRIQEIAAKHNLLILEDTCEALGAEWNGIKVGNFGVGSSFSFFFSHHMMTMEGGMICCQDPVVADHLRVMRAHGWLRNTAGNIKAEIDPEVDERYAFVNWGFNVRPTEVQAAFGLHQLLKLPGFVHRREMLAEKFRRYVDTVPFISNPRLHPSARPSWMALPVMVDREAPFARQDLVTYLEQAGVETRPIVAGNIAKQPVTRILKQDQLQIGELPGADKIHRHGFYIGLSPMMEENQMDRLLETFDHFLRKYLGATNADR